MAADRRRQGFQMAVLAYDQDLIQTPSKARIRRIADGPGKDLVGGGGRVRHRLQPRHRAGDGAGAAEGRREKDLCRRAQAGRLKSLIAEAPDRLAAVRDRRHQHGADRGGGARWPRT